MKSYKPPEKDPTMSIEAKKGDKIIFAYPDAGYEPDQLNAKKYLKINQVYTVFKTKISHWHTKVWLKEVPDIPFNSVLFKDVN